MKPYSTDYFEKKYRILSDRLLQKEGFIDTIKATRKELGIPEEGFGNTQELAYFLIGKMTKAEQLTLTFFAFVEAYAFKQKITVDDNNREEVIKAFVKQGYKQGIGMIPMMFELAKVIETHHDLIVNYPIFKKNKKLLAYPRTLTKLMQKFYGVDLLDDHVIFHYIEKYLLLGQTGINQYIKSKIACHNCKYLGIEHFSPRRADMEGQEEGAFSKNYIFNKNFVKKLSQHFNSVFLVVKPYATKEMMHQYIEDNWDDLKEHIVEKNTFYKQFDVNPTLIKESDDEKNRLVYELNKLSKKELLKKYKGQKDFTGNGIYKESIVSAILEEEYEIKMTSDAVKKSASRFAKSMKVQNVPKDIRDI